MWYNNFFSKVSIDDLVESELVKYRVVGVEMERERER